MHAEVIDRQIVVWRPPPWLWLAPAAVLLAIVFWPGLKDLIRVWSEREEYSYGFAIPVICAFLVWQRKDVLEKLPFTGAWQGFALAAIGIGLLVAARLSSIMILAQFSFLITVLGIALALTGPAAFKIVCVPLLLLTFMIPLPLWMLNEISYALQLVSSRLGVMLIRAFDISVYLDGNVIDLGAYKLQVAEACSGLRYLFPLMTLGFLAAYFFRGAWWKRAVIFVSTVPIAVLMNSLRIGAIGIAVERWGITMAEGMLHDFEGWVVFMACLAILVAEMWVLARVGHDRLPLREAFGLEFPAQQSRETRMHSRELPRPYLLAVGFLAVVATVSIAASERAHIKPARLDFANFPLQIDGWRGQRQRLDSVYLDILQMDDYIIADYADDFRRPVNLFVAYYNDQLERGIHSPRACVPGDGWTINSLAKKTVPGVTTPDGAPLVVNRAEIRKGDATQIVYYWFQQRGRSIVHEYQVKWYIFTDSFERNRSDGALVRLVTPVAGAEEPAQTERRLAAFTAALYPRLSAYIPD